MYIGKQTFLRLRAIRRFEFSIGILFMLSGFIWVLSAPYLMYRALDSVVVGYLAQNGGAIVMLMFCFVMAVIFLAEGLASAFIWRHNKRFASNSEIYSDLSWSDTFYRNFDDPLQKVFAKIIVSLIILIMVFGIPVTLVARFGHLRIVDKDAVEDAEFYGFIKGRRYMDRNFDCRSKPTSES